MFLLKKAKKIIISGYYGFDNFGDEAILEVLISQLKNQCENIEIVVLSKNPEKTSRSYAVKSIDRMNFWKIIIEMLTSNVILSGGGSLLQDVTSSISLYYYLLIILIGYFLGLKVIIYGQGIGPINGKLNEICTKNILKLAKYISVRDNNSLSLLNKLNIKAKLTQDAVWTSFDKDLLPYDLTKKTKDKSIIGVNLRQWNQLNEENLHNIAEIIIELFDFEGNEIRILPLHIEYDLNISEKLSELLVKHSKKMSVHIINKEYSSLIWKDLIKSCDKLIAMRYHALLVGMTNLVEVFGISYDPKVTLLMNSVGASYIDIKETDSLNFKNNMISWIQKSSNQLSYNTDNFIKYSLQSKESINDIVKIIQMERRK